VLLSTYDQYIFFCIIVYGSNAENSIEWAGYRWYLRDDQPFMKGPNNWNSSNVWIDAYNKLHLKLSKSPTTGSWTCAELYTKTKFSFGTFRWLIEGPIDKLDPNVVLGLFTYGGIDGTNEIDIEVAKWGQTDPEASNLFYTVYPRTLDTSKPVSTGTRLSLQGIYTTNQFTWSYNHVTSEIQEGFIIGPLTENRIFSYTTPKYFSSAVPYIRAPIHMNLWTFQGKPPINGEEVEIIIHDFNYTKA
jgi:hypothetical protein